MTDNTFTIGAKDIDAEAIVAGIRRTVDRKMQDGGYADPQVFRAERMNLANLRDEDNFLDFYLDCLRDTVFVDINDFEIIERRSRFGGCLVALKRTIWKLLKFYTYRLWSQQNHVNGMLLAAIDGMERSYRKRIAQLETRIRELEATQGHGEG